MRVNRVCGQWRTMSRVPERKSFGCAGSPTYLKRDRGPLDTRICRPGESRGHRYIVGSSLTSESGIRGPGTASEGTSPIRTAVALSPLRSSREDRHRSRRAGAPRRTPQGPPALLPSWGLTCQPRSPKRLGHRVAAGGSGIASPGRRLSGSETFLGSRWGDPGGCCGRPRFQSLIEPHCQRDPMAFWVNL